MNELVALLHRYMNEEARACESLCTKCAEIIRSYLLGKRSPFQSYFRTNREDVDDVMHQVFIKLLSGGLKNFRGTVDGQLVRYLIIIATNEANTFISRRGIPEKDTEQRKDGQTVDIPDKSPGPEQIAKGRECWQLVVEHLKKFPLKDQEIFISVAKGYTYQEIAERLGLPLSTIAFRFSKVKESLENALNTL